MAIYDFKLVTLSGHVTWTNAWWLFIYIYIYMPAHARTHTCLLYTSHCLMELCLVRFKTFANSVLLLVPTHTRSPVHNSMYWTSLTIHTINQPVLEGIIQNSVSPEVIILSNVNNSVNNVILITLIIITASNIASRFIGYV